MKIQPINTINIYSKEKISNSLSANKVAKNTSPQNFQLPNIYYVPFKSAKQATPIIVAPSTEEPQRKYYSNYPILYEHPSKFKLAKVNELPCPACGNSMLTKGEFKNFVNRLEKTNPDNYLYLLGEYKDYMRPIELSVYEDILARAKETGEPDLRLLLVSLRNERLPHLQRIQRRKLIQMKKVARTLPDEERRVLVDKLNELGKQIKRKDIESPFRRKRMISELETIQISDKEKYDKLQAYARAFPTSSDTNSAWIVKYSGKNKDNEYWTSREIAERMLFNSVANTDHILPYSVERGHDDITNYMAMHCGCNSTKGNKPFLQWYNELPETRQANLEAYFKEAERVINEGHIEDPKYTHYVAYATGTIEDITMGQVKLPCGDDTPKEILETEKQKPKPLHPKHQKSIEAKNTQKQI